MTYNPGQFNAILPFIEGVPEWVIVVGTADGDEAQCAATAWPSLGNNIIGVEPVEENIIWQKANGFPTANLFSAAIGASSVGTTTLFLSNRVNDMPRNSSTECDRGGATIEVPMISIDWLQYKFGFDRNVLIWMDIEGDEYKGLQGAVKTFGMNAVKWILLEEVTRAKFNVLFIQQFMAIHGFQPVATFNQHPNNECCDRLYVRN
tara:strand:+ start:190 stop:804 length:615 start_codon:yes stop_codon:yes gene_type:complete